MTTSVVNIHHYKEIPDDWVYIGRKGRGEDGYFGNPFILGEDGDRDEILALYTDWFIERMTIDPVFAERIEQLRGKTLVCFCKPLFCHGDVIAAFLNYEE